MVSAFSLQIPFKISLQNMGPVAKRPVQQAMVAHHVAAELHHNGFRVTSWDVWIRLVELPRVEGGPQHE